MTGASLEYSGYYNGTSLVAIGTVGDWHSSAVRRNDFSGYLDVYNGGRVNPQHMGNKYTGRAVRYDKITDLFHSNAERTRSAYYGYPP